MKHEDYRDILRGMPCCFSGKQGDQMISWHHLKCLKQSGTGMKSPPWATIPVADRPHKQCHSYEITRSTQVQAMLLTWVEIGCREVGEEEFWRRMGEAYAEIIGLDK